MKNRLQQYSSLVFDCDGVILDSNAVKTDAFYEVALPFGEQAARAFVAYHQANGGISRYRKFEYFLRSIVQAENYESLMPSLLDKYAAAVYSGLMSCRIAPGLHELRERTAHCRWLVASGGDQRELREVFAARGLDSLFESGIFGSPMPKNEILTHAQEQGRLQMPALFLGDSRFDYECAAGAGMDFVFLSAWSEFVDAESFFKDKPVVVLDALKNLLDGDGSDGA